VEAERTLEVSARSTAAPGVVWALLVDATAWSRWSRIPRAVREREGTPAPDGVGSIRKLGAAGFGSREEVVAFEPERHFAYTLLSGLPVREYRADVELNPDGDGTTIVWRARFTPRWPMTGPALEWFLRRTLTGFATGLARYAANPDLGGFRATSR